MKHALRLSSLCAAGLVAACVSAAPTASPTLSPETPSLPTTPTFSLSPVSPPTSTPISSPSISASPTPSPTSIFTPLPGVTLAEQLSATLQAALDETRVSRAIPGIGASIIFPDGSRWDSGSGDGVVDEQAAGADTPFVVGSITKTFVAALIMQLAEEGQLSLEDRLAEWFPDYPRADEITLRHLLAHTSGIHNYFEHRSYSTLVYGRPSHDWTPREILQAFDSPPYFEPGTGYSYSNTGYILLGMVAQQVTGEPLATELERRYFSPLLLNETYFQTDESLVPTAAHGYLMRDGALADVTDDSGYRPSRSAATVAWAAGAVVGSARDMSNWASALYGGDVVAPDSLAQMTDYTANGYEIAEYGLGTRTSLFGDHRAFGHTGSLRGFSSAMWHFPEIDLTITVLTNRGRLDTYPIIDALAAITLPAAESAAVDLP